MAFYLVRYKNNKILPKIYESKKRPGALLLLHNNFRIYINYFVLFKEKDRSY